MLNYSDIKNYYTKFINDYSEDVKSFWDNYFEILSKFYKK